MEKVRWGVLSTADIATTNMEFVLLSFLALLPAQA